MTITKYDFNTLPKNSEGNPVCKTRDGRTVEIIRTNLQGKFPVAGIIYGEVNQWCNNGKYYQFSDSAFDLVLPEPWRLTDSVNGFVLPKGRSWMHCDDSDQWIPKHLPDGYRPMMDGELPSEGDEVLEIGGWTVQNKDQLKTTCRNGQKLQRTKRSTVPDPLAEIKKAHSEGKQIQINLGGRVGWCDMTVYNPSWDNGPDGYRLKPEPEYVPLDRTDVKMGQEVSCNNGADTYMITGINDGAVFAGNMLTFTRLFDGNWTINRNDGKGWVPCSKQKIS